jgi:hypothetical protein
VTRTILLLDLDDTVMLSRRKLSARGLETAELPVAAYDSSGEALCFSLEAHTALLDQFKGAEIIPVTGRSEAAMRRVRLPFTSWRVLDHGATILNPAGEREAEWDDELKTDVTLLDGLDDELSRRHPASEGYRLSVLEHKQGRYGLCLKHAERDVQATQAAIQTMRALALSRSLRFLDAPGAPSLVLPGVGKREACAWLLARIGVGAVIFGAGDARADLGFLSLCDFAVLPRDSDLMRDLQAEASRVPS